jgi:ABC-type glycerol-3-phosphate transport system permease component
MRLSPNDRIFYILDYGLLVFMGLIVLFPLLNVFSNALSDPAEVVAGRVKFLPRNFTVSTIKMILEDPNITRGFVNTLWYAGVGTAINLFMTVICAYPLCRSELRGRTVISIFFAITLFFGGGMIPTYLNIKNLGLLNTRWVLVIPGAISFGNVIMCRTFFQNTIPKEMYESAEMDGASDIRMLVSIVLPLSGPILAVLTLFFAVGHWNSYFSAMMYLSNPKLYSIQLILRNAISNIASILRSTEDMAAMQASIAFAEATKYGLIVITMIPVLVIYPFVQKYFVKGIMIGSIKG